MAGSLPCPIDCECGKHKRPRRYWTPEERDRRFWLAVRKTKNCWTWKLSKNPKGYGYFQCYGRPMQLAHRASWELTQGDIPKGMCVLHRCDNPSCVRPDHLFLGSVTLNNQDMADKGRAAQGERHYQARFTNDEVRALRERSSQTGIGYRRLAREQGVSTKTMQDLLRGRTYREVLL